MAFTNDTPLPPLGFICIDCKLHRPPGDPFNGYTWSFPLIHEKADNSPVSAVVSSDKYDDGFVDRFVDAGMRLAERGAVGIITSCGFLAMAQQELAARLPVPITTSSLVQIPSLLTLLPPSRSVGILTYDETRLGKSHLEKLGIPASRCHIRGAPSNGTLRRHIELGVQYVHEDISAELVAVSRQLVVDHSEIAVLCLECTNMPPFSEAIQSATGLPVYDVYTMGQWFYGGLARGRPPKWGDIPKDKLETRA
ncbi:putative Aspartate/glutamate racemase family protein [Seiridium cardinale]|uniref:Aspartate/glutamate racemase family protein n=1 Tax=Seiridium cardinale TaxID=138064 RepID=A0ABR2Y5K8_9PEZI